MSDCINTITADMLAVCSDAPKKGIDSGMGVLINVEDIDLTASTVAGAKITDLVLKAGKSGFKVEWFKDLASGEAAYVPSTEDLDGFSHTFRTRLSTPSGDAAERANELKNGTFIMVYETKYKGVSSVEAFKVAGWGQGLRLSELTYNTLENSAALLFALATEEGDFEQYPYHTFLETDYDTSKATFESLFAVA